ncbi:Phage capsid family protein [Gemmata sp. SH-PL17]|uniref:phage major capsid protein n=1 Tax=Gemmata sp. SH-PL17 TaxID=1630693 RepID=UPI00078EB904|nr:phage major capsid protein [Gemmata sp. SH-PL17]AMV23430.1 Phage capsid family protein [Gemmata sp. SH-PL17]
MSKAFQLKDLREKRGKVRKELEAMGSKLKTEARAMSADERAAFDKLQKDWTSLGDAYRTAEADIQAIDDLLGQDSGSDNTDPNANGGQNSNRQPGRENRDTRPAPRERRNDRNADEAIELRKVAFQAWARTQHELPMTREQKVACKRTGLNPRAKVFQFRFGGPKSLLKRALGVGTSSLGGATVAPDFAYEMEKALVDFSNVRGVVGQFTTDTGVDLPYPTEDDTGNEGAQLGESEETDFEDDNFGSVTFKGFKFTSKGILISNELLNDSAFDLESHIGEQIGNRIGRVQGRKFTVGSGTGEPEGIVTAASLGITAAAAAAFTADELTRLAFSVDRAYRSDSSCGYMMHDSAVAYALLLKDTQGRPLLRDSYRDGIATLVCNGFTVNTNQYMDALPAGVPVTAKKHVLFGAMSKHKIRDVGVVRVRRLDERYAEKDQVGFVGFARGDSRCVNKKAIKYLLQA